MALKYRVGRLEDQARASSPARCPGCVHAAGDGFELKITAPGAVASLDELPAATEQPGDRCPRCGGQIVFRISPPGRSRPGG